MAMTCLLPLPNKALFKATTRMFSSLTSAALGMKISIDHKPGAERGRLTISYDTLDQLDALCGILST